MVLDKGEFKTTQRMVEPIGFRPTKQALKLSTLLSNLHDIAKGFDKELLANNNFGYCHLGVEYNPPP